MSSGNDHGEDAYGILEPDVNTGNIDGKHSPMNANINLFVNLKKPMYILMSWLLDCLGDGNLGEAGDIDSDEEARMFAQQGRIIAMMS